MAGSVIYSTGSYIPENVVRNDDLKQFPESSKFLISRKTGVFSRRYAGEDECTSDLASKAGRDCLDKIGFPSSEVECIIVSTSSPDRIQPATATRVQHMLGAVNAFAFDINSVCSGSAYGIRIADALIKSGQCENVLFIASEVYSKILNKKDFSTCPYFGDGAGAILFRAGEEGQGVLHSCLRTDGGKCDTISVPGGGTMLPFEKMKSPRSAYFRMKGKEVFEFAVSRGAEIIVRVLAEAGVMLESVARFVCHQANLNIILEISERIGVSPDNFYINVFRYGNTASASVPIALDEALTRGFLKKGDLAVTAAYGGGLSWGANLIRI
jgi:3-oxoacyl-[acyl-carrier-protein] synthase-3